jgi:glycosyltransferase involved in cell wall biosynthesis
VEAGELRRPHPWQVCERGIQVRPGDPEAFADALAHLVNDPALRQTLGERGRGYVERNYSVERLVADVRRLYGRLAGGADEAAAESALLKF